MKATEIIFPVYPVTLSLVPQKGEQQIVSCTNLNLKVQYLLKKQI